MDQGTYTLLLELETTTSITFGAAGTRRLDAGYYAYTGSALGPGGLSRVDRHRKVCDGTNMTRQWHIDYLLGAAETTWVGVWSAAVARECDYAETLPGTAIEGIGASDCACESHLSYSSTRDRLVNELEAIYNGFSRD
ncbi:GIY-YIG nuclease family protein [Halodesulfurarchaeum sp.]|uniref:GIY-YIG nuclease family protein n=1 Tax=Halodesulfurarchaeum sp. TaxID=1980530 RepID=UPI002FC3B720